MFEKKNFILNCDVCDTRKMKEEDYSGYEKMLINADIVIVNEMSKGILNRLPLTLNHDKMIELSDGVEITIRSINGSYEITAATAEQEHTLLVVNGNLRIHPGTEENLKKYEQISVNGCVRCPRSLEGFLNRLSVNGSICTYPDDCVVLEDRFVMDPYFPLRARECSKYYAESEVIIGDKNIDLTKLVQKKVQFITDRLVVLECKIDECTQLFGEQVKFVVVPDGMELVLGDVELTEELVRKAGRRLFIYGNLKLENNPDADKACEMVEKLVVNGTVSMKKEQKDAFAKIQAEYENLTVVKNGRCLQNMVKLKIDRNLLENSPEGVVVQNVATVSIAEDVTPEMILEKLTIMNCANVSCNEAQESAVSAIGQNLAHVGEAKEEERMGDIFGVIRDLAHTKLTNADSYTL